MKLLVSVGSDFLGQWLPACLAAALPEGTVRMVGKLWVDGLEARRMGLSYRCPPIVQQPDIAVDQALRAVILQEIESFAPNALVYLTAESVMGRASIEVAEIAGLPALGLQTFFKRDSVLMHRAGLDWWKLVRDMPLCATSGTNGEDLVRNRSLYELSATIPRAHPARLWAGRAERVLRTTLGSGFDHPFGALTKRLRVGRVPETTLLSPKWPQATLPFSKPPVVVALHRPILPCSEPDWFDLIRFALEAVPPEIPLVLRPHPDESPCALPVDLVERLKKRLIAVSSKGHGPDLDRLISSARLMLTLNSAVGMQALILGTPVVTITSTYYTRSGMAEYIKPDCPKDLLQQLKSNNICRPNSQVVDAFKRKVSNELSAPLPNFGTKIIPAHQLLASIQNCLKDPVNRPRFCEG